MDGAWEGVASEGGAGPGEWVWIGLRRFGAGPMRAGLELAVEGVALGAGPEMGVAWEGGA